MHCNATNAPCDSGEMSHETETAIGQGERSGVLDPERREDRFRSRGAGLPASWCIRRSWASSGIRKRPTSCGKPFRTDNARLNRAQIRNRLVVKDYEAQAKQSRVHIVEKPYALAAPIGSARFPKRGGCAGLRRCSPFRIFAERPESARFNMIAEATRRPAETSREPNRLRRRRIGNSRTALDRPHRAGPHRQTVEGPSRRTQELRAAGFLRSPSAIRPTTWAIASSASRWPAPPMRQIPTGARPRRSFPSRPSGSR